MKGHNFSFLSSWYWQITTATTAKCVSGLTILWKGRDAFQLWRHNEVDYEETVTLLGRKSKRGTCPAFKDNPGWPTTNGLLLVRIHARRILPQIIPKSNVFISGRKSKTNFRHHFEACTQQVTSTAVFFFFQRHTFVFAVDFILSPFFQFESCC